MATTCRHFVAAHARRHLVAAHTRRHFVAVATRRHFVTGECVRLTAAWDRFPIEGRFISCL